MSWNDHPQYGGPPFTWWKALIVLGVWILMGVLMIIGGNYLLAA